MGMWPGYVAEHLLPRIYGFDLLMAPYAVAHMKLGLQLKESGYDFASDERLRVYLTNTLEEVHELTRFDQVKSATLPCARITLIKFQGFISADFRTICANASTPSVYGHANCMSTMNCRRERTCQLFYTRARQKL